MVIFEHDAIVEAHAVVGSAAASNGVFLKIAETGGGFSGVDDFDAEVGDFLHELMSEGGDPAELHEEI